MQPAAALISLIGITVMIGAPLAIATLGEPEATVRTDGNTLKAVKQEQRACNGYHIQEIRTASSAIREFVSPEGIVFAIGWNGLAHPDLNQLLGSYAADFRSAMAKAPRQPGRKPLRVKAERVVVEKWGHMRNLQGRAYIPSLIPPGVSLNEIR